MEKKYPPITMAVLPIPKVMSVNISENGAVELSEYEGKFLKVVLDALGTDYNVVVPDDNLFGDLGRNGSWSGMIGMVQRGEADLAFTSLSITEERMEAVNFSVAYAIDACIFATAMPESIKSAFAFLHPFETATWIAVFVTLSLMAHLFAKIYKSKYAVFKSFFKLFANFCRQDSMQEDGSLKYRILLMTWFLFTTVITCCYSATLLSFLIQPIKGTTIRTFSELSKAVQRGSHKAIFYTFSLSFLLNSKDDDLIALGEIVQRNKWFLEMQDPGGQLYINSHTVQALNRKAARLSHENREDFYLSEDTLYFSPVAFAYGKNFCCPSKLNSILLRLSTAGLYEKFLQDSSMKYFLKTPRTTESSRSNTSLSLSDLLGAFVLLGVGSILSIGVFVGEICHRILYSARK